MAARVPVLREHDILEARGEAVHHRHDFVAARHGEHATGTEIVLDVDHDQAIRGHKGCCCS